MKNILLNVGIAGLFVGLSAWIVAQSPNFPVLQGFYPTGKKYIPFQVDSTGKLKISNSGGGGTIAKTTNVLKGDNAGNAIDAGFAATAAGIVSLFSGCSGTLYLGADGACHASGGTTNQNIRTIGASFGSFQSGATPISGAATACTETFLTGTIQSVEIIGNVSGSATIDIKTVAHSSWTGTASAATSITASDIPALSSSAVYTDTTLTGWTTSVSAGTDFCFVMTSPTTVAGLHIELKVAAN
jgi:hypothetical protein